jgi:beta-N-acetylhexosaminidase
VPDRRTVARRRLALLLAALLALVAGVVIGASAGDDGGSGGGGKTGGAAAPPAQQQRERAAVDRLTLRQQVGQVIVMRFAGTSPPAYVRRALRERRAAGAILFRDNVVDPAQLRALTRALRKAGGDPVIAVDQEGGEIRIVPWAPPAAGEPQQAAAGTVRRDARAAARALHAAGVTVTLAPVGDVPSVANAAMSGREFSRDPAASAQAMEASVAGWRAGGVAPTAKHFPGLGGATVNTDDGPATIDRSAQELAATDLPPFEAAIRTGVPLVMVGHARYPAIDPDRIASQSRPILEDLLRRRLGFKGVVITDSMEAAASTATGSIEAASERALLAGADLLLLTGQGSFAPVSAHLLARARRSPALRARIRESTARVLALRAASAHTAAP